MASYPSAVKTFTSKADGAGNKIFASHINDLQDEVHAIEDGLLNGTAPLSASNASLAHLSVALGSTLASLTVSAGSTLQTLSVVSNSTLGGAVFVGGVNSSAVASTLTDIAVKDSAAICWGNAANSSWGAMLAWKDFGAIASTTPQSLTVFAAQSGVLVTFLTNAPAGFDVAAQFYLRPTVAGVLAITTAGTFGSTAGDASKINIYWDSTALRYVLENKTGQSVTIKAKFERGF